MKEFQWVKLSDGYECCWTKHVLLRIVSASGESVLCGSYGEAMKLLGCLHRKQLYRIFKKGKCVAAGIIKGDVTVENFDCRAQVCCPNMST